MRNFLYNIWIYFQLRKLRKKYELTEDGARLGRYLKGKLDGSIDYTIQRYDDSIKELAEKADCSEEEVVAFLLLGMEIMEGDI